MKFKTFMMIAALGAAMLPAHAMSLDTGEGHRFLIIDIADEDVSYPREIVEALKMGGYVTLNWEIAHKVDPEFEVDNIGSVFCDDVSKAKGFDPETAPMNCRNSSVAIMTWLGKFGWRLQGGVILGKQMIFVKPWSSK